jgi:hypothetical protein
MACKNRLVWRKMDPFLAQTRPANQLQDFCCAGVLELVQTLISGLQLPNFIFNCVKFFAESPAFDCKICLVKNKIFAVSPQNQNLNKLLAKNTAWRRAIGFVEHIYINQMCVRASVRGIVIAHGTKNRQNVGKQRFKWRAVLRADWVLR